MLAFAITGLVLTLYTIYVEKRHSRDKNYKAVCDINNRISCSYVISSEYAKLVGKMFRLSDDSVFNVPNTYYGTLFFIAVILYNIYPFTLIPYREYMLLTASVLSLIVCVVLAYVMHYRLKKYCLMCIVTYFTNIGIFFYALKEI